MTLQDAPAPFMPWQLALAIGLIAGVLLGLVAYYLIDRFQFLPHITIRDLRHAGWRARKERA